MASRTSAAMSRPVSTWINFSGDMSLSFSLPGGQQLMQTLRIDRLGQVQVAPGSEGEFLLLDPAKARDSHHQAIFQSGQFTEPAGQFPAVHPRHLNVQKHHIGTMPLRELQGGGT